MDSSLQTASARERVLHIIWNITRICPWCCSICCVDAVHVSRRSRGVLVRSHGLARLRVLPGEGGRGIYDTAAAYVQQEGWELDIGKKLAVVDHIATCRRPIELDFSGGDPLVVADNLEVMRHAAEVLGRDSISVTTTGAGLRLREPAEIARLVSQVEFTYDAPAAELDHRPSGYNRGNLACVERLAGLGVRLKVLVPITRSLLSADAVERLYKALHDAGVGVLLLMRLFPVGRGAHATDLIPSAEEYRRVIQTFRDVERAVRGPRVRLQCALRGLEAPGGVNPCDMGRDSVAITADGILLLSAWAMGEEGRPLGPEWVVGSIADEPLASLMSRAQVDTLARRGDENSGHCKIFSWLHGGRTPEAMFTKTDPLHASITTAPPRDLPRAEHAGAPPGVV